MNTRYPVETSKLPLSNPPEFQRDLLARIFQIPVKFLLQTQLLRPLPQRASGFGKTFISSGPAVADMRDSLFTSNSGAKPVALPGFNIPVLKSLIARLNSGVRRAPPSRLPFAGRQYTKQFSLSQAAADNRLEPLRTPRAGALSASKIVPSRSWYLHHTYGIQSPVHTSVEGRLPWKK